jgi:hypothetical protein
MDYMKESEQVSITQITTAYVFCVMVGALSVSNALLHSKSLIDIAGWSVAALAAVAGIVLCTRKIGQSVNGKSLKA